MAERLIARERSLSFGSAIPVITQESVPSSIVATALRPDIAAWHDHNLRELYKFQKEQDQGCFFIGLYAMSAALYPDRLLPSADDFLSGIRPKYGGDNGVLEPDKLLVPNDRLAQALDIYGEYGMKVSRLTRNAKAEQVLCNNLLGLQQQGLIRDTHSYAPIDITPFTPPFAVWMHEGVTSQAHFVTVDGSQEAMNMIRDYQQDKKYFVKMVIEVERQNKGWEGEQPDAAR